MTSFHGKVIAITGAASGIGLATARECAARGASLALADIQSGLLASVVDEFKTQGINVKGTVLDVTSSASVDSWIADTVQCFGHLDGAANMAGVGNKGKDGGDVVTEITETSDKGWDFIIGINLTGLFYCLRAELRVMGEGGSIVNASSTAGLTGSLGVGAYSASKHGILGLTKTAAKEVGKKGIRVNAVAPGPVDTPLLRQFLMSMKEKASGPPPAPNPIPRLGSAEEVAKSVCFLLSDDSSWTTGTCLSVDGGAVC